MSETIENSSMSTSTSGFEFGDRRYKSFTTVINDNAGWKQRYEALENEFDSLKEKYDGAVQTITCLQQDKAKLLRFMLERRKQLKGGRGKNTVNVTNLNNDCPENGSNYGAVSKFVVNKLFRRHKFLRPGWDEWSTTPQTVCHGVTSLISYPKELTADYEQQLYWREVLVPMVNKKMSSIKGNITQAMKKIYLGKKICT